MNNKKKHTEKTVADAGMESRTISYNVERT